MGHVETEVLPVLGGCAGLGSTGCAWCSVLGCLPTVGQRRVEAEGSSFCRARGSLHGLG